MAEFINQVPLLERLAQSYRNNRMIAAEVLRGVAVAQLDFDYVEWDRAGSYKVPETKMSANATPNELEVKGTKKSSRLDTQALRSWIDPQEELQAGSAWNVEATKTQQLLDAMYLRREVDVAAKLTDTAVMTINVTLAGNDQWSAAATSSPLKDVLTQGARMLYRPNVMAVGRQVHDKLLLHPEIQEAIKYTQFGVPSEELLARYFGVRKYVVGEAFKDSAAPGQAESLAFVWGKHAILGYVHEGEPSSSMDEPSLGYLPRIGGSHQNPFRVYVGKDSGRGTREGSRFVKVESESGILMTGPTILGALIKNAVA